MEDIVIDNIDVENIVFGDIDIESIDIDNIVFGIIVIEQIAHQLYSSSIICIKTSNLDFIKMLMK